MKGRNYHLIGRELERYYPDLADVLEKDRLAKSCSCSFEEIKEVYNRFQKFRAVPVKKKDETQIRMEFILLISMHYDPAVFEGYPMSPGLRPFFVKSLKYQAFTCFDGFNSGQEQSKFI